MSHSENTAIDLARLALRRARADASKRPASAVKAPTTGRATGLRRGGLDPVGLGTALSDLMTQHAWQAPLAGRELLDLWPAAVGDLASHVTAVSFDHQTGQLEVRAESPAYATHVRALALVLVAKINQAQGETILRSIRVLSSYGTRPAEEPRRSVRYGEGAAQAPKIKTREDASPGYLRALAQLQASRPSAPADSRTSPAVDRRIRTLARETVSRLSGPRPR
ncbi:DciA family protein [Kitasatospora sp. NPDC127116]|uniref:DciA family protein n=1 Tax=Kitasatospora sp. NPDC127116 TaxID=3345367 RepID=UPI0036361C38